MEKLLLINARKGTDELYLKVHKGFTKENIGQMINISKGFKPLGNDQDKLYFLPGCSVPRMKVRDKYSCTITPKYATAAFISKENLGGSDTMFSKIKMLKINKNQADSMMQTLSIKNQHLLPTYNSLKDHVNYIALGDEMICKDRWWDEVGNNYSANNLTDLSYWNFKDRLNGQHQDDHWFFTIGKDSKLNDLNCNIYDEKEILGLLNEDKITIDDAQYEQFRLMGQTKNEEELTFMMEMMANANYEESLMNIVLLMAEFKKDIHERKKQKDQVNFRSLLVYLGVKSNQIEDLTIGDFTKILKDKHQFTKTNAFTLSQFFANMPDGEYKKAGNSMWTKGPILKPDYIKTDD